MPVRGELNHYRRACRRWQPLSGALQQQSGAGIQRLASDFRHGLTRVSR